MANFKVSKWFSQTRLTNARTRYRYSGSQNAPGVRLFGWPYRCEHPTSDRDASNLTSYPEFMVSSDEQKDGINGY